MKISTESLNLPKLPHDSATVSFGIWEPPEGLRKKIWLGFMKVWLATLYSEWFYHEISIYRKLTNKYNQHLSLKWINFYWYFIKLNTLLKEKNEKII